MKTNTARGWSSAIGALIATMFGTTVVSSLSIFIMPIVQATGVKVTQITLIFTLSALGSMICAFFTGPVVKALPRKLIYLLGAASNLAVMLSVAFCMDNLIVLYICAVFHGFGSIYAGTTMYQIVVSEWFDKGRGTLFSLTSIFISGCSAVMIPVNATLVANLGYQNAALIIGIYVFILMAVPGVFLVSAGSPGKYGMNPIDFKEKAKDIEKEKAKQAAPVVSLSIMQVMKTPVIWLILLVAFLGSFASRAYATLASPYYQSMGLDSIQAAFMISIVNITGFVSSLLFGIISDKVNTKIAALVFGTIASIGFLLAYVWHGLVMAIIAAVCFGCTQCIANLFPPTHATQVYGRGPATPGMLGYLRVAMTAGSIISPMIAGIMLDATGEFGGLLTIMGVLVVIAVILSQIATGKKMTEKLDAFKAKAAEAAESEKLQAQNAQA